MIKIYSNIIEKKECNEFINFYKNNINKIIKVHDDGVYHFDGISLMDNLYNFNFLKKLNLNPIVVDRIRIQHVDKNTPIIEIPHTDKEPFTFIIFLNDDYNGGSLVFDNIEIQPKVSQLIYNTGDEPHYVKKVNSGNRFTLVCFLKQNIEFTKLKNML